LFKFNDFLPVEWGYGHGDRNAVIGENGNEKCVGKYGLGQ